jgi:hypothetical protein
LHRFAAICTEGCRGGFCRKVKRRRQIGAEDVVQQRLATQQAKYPREDSNL